MNKELLNDKFGELSVLFFMLDQTYEGFDVFVQDMLVELLCDETTPARCIYDIVVKINELEQRIIRMPELEY